MQADTEEILDWASRKMGVRFRDPGERRQKALAGLVDSGFAPEAEAVRAISTLLHYEPGRPFSAPFLTPADLREIERDRLREKVIAELQTLPDLPLDQRIGAYHQLRQEAGGDPWLQQRVYRAAELVVGDVGRIEPGDPLRWLVLLPSEAVLKRPAPPPPEPLQFIEEVVVRPTRIISRTPVGRPFNPNLTPWQCVLVVLAFVAFGFLMVIFEDYRKSNRSNQGNSFTNGTRINDDHTPSHQVPQPPIPPVRVIDTSPDGTRKKLTIPSYLRPADVKRIQDLLKSEGSGFPPTPILPASPAPNSHAIPAAP